MHITANAYTQCFWLETECRAETYAAIDGLEATAQVINWTHGGQNLLWVYGWLRCNGDEHLDEESSPCPN